VLAPAKIAGHAQRLRVGVDDDHGVDAIFLALAAVVLDGLSCTVLAWRRHRRLRS
jgi:hypothetical protein